MEQEHDRNKFCHFTWCFGTSSIVLCNYTHTIIPQPYTLNLTNSVIQPQPYPLISQHHPHSYSKLKMRSLVLCADSMYKLILQNVFCPKMSLSHVTGPPNFNHPFITPKIKVL